jgi:hypothetical protein
MTWFLKNENYNLLLMKKTQAPSYIRPEGWDLHNLNSATSPNYITLSAHKQPHKKNGNVWTVPQWAFVIYVISVLYQQLFMLCFHLASLFLLLISLFYTSFIFFNIFLRYPSKLVLALKFLIFFKIFMISQEILKNLVRKGYKS